MEPYLDTHLSYPLVSPDFQTHRCLISSHFHEPFRTQPRFRLLCNPIIYLHGHKTKQRYSTVRLLSKRLGTTTFKAFLAVLLALGVS